MIRRLVFSGYEYLKARMSPKFDRNTGLGGGLQANATKIAFEPEAYFQFRVGPGYMGIDRFNFVTSRRSMATKVRKSFNFHLLPVSDLDRDAITFRSAWVLKSSASP
ncbi:MAG: hypothetical protein JO166_09980 [Deltaproteobacteria bacterium]|nr:hypothetical protein [Deltaproteobacteria bacterium]